MKLSETSILAPYRACGLICSDIRPVYQPLLNAPSHGEICCAIDNVICIYTIKPFRLRLVTDSLKGNISVVARSSRFLFAVVDKSITVFKEHRVLKRYSVERNVKFLLPCGEEAFMVVDEENKIFVFELVSEECIVEIELPKRFNVTAVVHPLGYVNQIVVGAEDGRMRLLDVQKGALVREFPADKNFNAKITVLEQSTAADVLAVGMSDGRIHLRNIKSDRLLFSFRHEGCITALSFRSDELEMLISGSDDGSIAVWDMDKQILVGQKTDAHKGPIVSLNFLLGESFFVSSGTDNRLVKWVVKDELSLPEVIKDIEGPSEPVSSVSFTSSRSLLFASKDGQMRQFYAFQHGNSLKTMGAARQVKRSDIGHNRFIDMRMTSILEMEMVHAREAVWDNVICRHENSPLISTWSTRRFTRGSHLLYHKRFENNPQYLAAYATSIFLSSCGTFVLVGYSSGHLDVFNIQSGRYRNSFGYSANPEKKIKEDDIVAHEGKVTGIALDMLNQIVVSGSSDSSIHFWCFKTSKLRNRVSSPAGGGVLKFRLNRFNSLLAVAFENGDLAIVDVLCRRVARRFEKAHSSANVLTEEQPVKITAMEFSPDGKWLVSADDVCVIKIWDLSSSCLIDVMRCTIMCIGLSFNDTGEFLATIHEGQRSICIWANKALFLPNFNRLSLDNDVANMWPDVCQMPTIASSTLPRNDDDVDETEDFNESVGACRVVIIDEEENDLTNLNETILNDSIPKKMSLVTLSGLPPSRWANLSQLELIRERNKPIEPPKKPKSAPFFLPTTDTLEGFSFDKIDDGGDKMLVDDKENVTNVLMAKHTTDILQTSWAKSLLSALNGKELMQVYNALKAMNISSIDFQIRSLPYDAFRPFLEMLSEVLEKRTDYELVQSYLAAFLNIHHETLWGEQSSEDIKDLTDENAESLTEVLERVLSLQKSSWNNVQQLIYANTSLAKWIKSALI